MDILSFFIITFDRIHFFAYSFLLEFFGVIEGSEDTTYFMTAIQFISCIFMSAIVVSLSLILFLTCLFCYRLTERAGKSLIKEKKE